MLCYVMLYVQPECNKSYIMLCYVTKMISPSTPFLINLIEIQYYMGKLECHQNVKCNIHHALLIQLLHTLYSDHLK